jgi:N-acetylmuramoyl-L-alanine amidase
MKITHSAGHALTTPGKQSPDGYKEWSYTDKIVRLVMQELEKYEGVVQKRIDDPTGKTDYPLIVRTNMVNSFNGHLHIDYHLNAFGSDWSTPGGTEVFVYKTSLKEAYSLAQKVQNNLVKELGFANRGVKAGDLHMIRETKPTSILIEFAFMSNQNEAMKMRTAEYQKKAAQAVVDGIVSQYGLKKKYIAPLVPKDTTKYRLRSGAFSSAAELTKALTIIKHQYGWLTYEKADTTELNPTYRFVTGTFEGRELADQMAKELKDKYGWLVYVDKV